MRYSVKSGTESRQFQFSIPIIPNFFFSIIQSGVMRIELHPGVLRTQVLANGLTYLESPRCCFTHHYSDGSYVNIHGAIKCILNQNLKLDWLDFQTHVFIPGIEWPQLETFLSDEDKMRGIFEDFLKTNSDDNVDANENDDKKDIMDEDNKSELSMNSNASTVKKEERKNFNSKSKDNKKVQLLQKVRSNYQVFHGMSNFGLQESVMRVMQVSDVMSNLASLMLYSINGEENGPLNSFETYVDKYYTKKDDDKVKKIKGNNGINSKSPNSSNGQKTSPVSNNNGITNSSSRQQKQPGSPQSSGRSTKIPTNLDLSQSTLNKRRRKSTINLSPKSVSDSPKLPGTESKPKKAKR
jgi:hypothetical protein